ncbi:MAG: hypothetical protein CBB97_24110 [Candidatus Endolissoclinum sp. TMED37]|nr:MAG: hypothetical protein CBB97_24110 [Candidatus Endolissoclinum sp. TMED37]
MVFFKFKSCYIVFNSREPYLKKQKKAISLSQKHNNFKIVSKVNLKKNGSLNSKINMLYRGISNLKKSVACLFF